MRKQPDSWKQKVNSGFLESALIYKESVEAWKALGPNPPAELVAPIHTRVQEKLEGIRKSYPDLGLHSSMFDMIYVEGPPGWPPSQRDLDQGFLENLYWKHYREPLWIALQKVKSGDLQAYRRVMRVGEDYQRHQFNKGPIKPAKGDPDHSALLEMGLDMGLNELTPEDLADCFDVICPCGKSHDADALKKQRLRIRTAFEEMKTWLYKERAKIPTRERMVVYGKDGLAARGVRSQDGKTREVVVGVRRGPPPPPKEGYFLADCRIREDERLEIREGSPFTSRAVLRKLPTAFNVKTIRELFAMFFPD